MGDGVEQWLLVDKSELRVSVWKESWDSVPFAFEMRLRATVLLEQHAGAVPRGATARPCTDGQQSPQASWAQPGDSLGQVSLHRLLLEYVQKMFILTFVFPEKPDFLPSVYAARSIVLIRF